MSGDVAVEADVQRCVRRLERPLKGVFHLAGALDDRLLDDMSAESLRRVFAPKASGALHLHRATAGHELDHFRPLLVHGIDTRQPGADQLQRGPTVSWTAWPRPATGGVCPV